MGVNYKIYVVWIKIRGEFDTHLAQGRKFCGAKWAGEIKVEKLGSIDQPWFGG
jgi:hypothetical protein